MWRQCIMPVASTGKVSYGEATKAVSETLEKDKKENGKKGKGELTGGVVVVGVLCQAHRQEYPHLYISFGDH